MEQLQTRLEGLVLIEPVVHADERGFFHETFRQSTFSELGIADAFVQENHSRSVRGVVRGMHFQIGRGTSKLVRCPRGAIVDVVVDIRVGSPTFGEWESFELDDENLRQLYVPIGFAHGFCTVSDVADVLYKCDSYYSGETERGFSYRDPDVAIEWPEIDLLPSARDDEAPALAEVADELTFAYGATRA